MSSSDVTSLNVKGDMSNNNPNKTLYKYYGSQNWGRVFCPESWTVRFTPPSELNDPFENNPHIKGVRGVDAGRSRLSELGFGREKSSQMQEIIATDRNECIRQVNDAVFGVLSLTEDRNNLLMWSHYAENHKGFVVGFNISDAFFNKTFLNNTYKPKEVLYNDERPSKYIVDLDYNCYLFTKGNIWKYEKEWRVVFNIDTPSISNENIFGVLPTRNTRGICKLPKTAVESIIFGANYDQNDLENNVNYIISLSECSHIKLYKSSLDDKHYSVNYDRIP